MYARTLLLLLITLPLFLTACDDEDTTWAGPAGVGIPWPPTYPIVGDSLVEFTIEQDSVGVLGTITMELFPDSAPNHVRNFKYLVNTGFYDSTLIHRVIAGFVIQGGDPTGTGAGGAGWTLNEEFNWIPHQRGILSMARSVEPNSASSQFFVCHANAPHLDHQYTVFGRVVSGMPVVDAIATTPVNDERPVHEIRIVSASVIASN